MSRDNGMFAALVGGKAGGREGYFMKLCGIVLMVFAISGCVIQPNPARVKQLIRPEMLRLIEQLNHEIAKLDQRYLTLRQECEGERDKMRRAHYEQKPRLWDIMVNGFKPDPELTREENEEVERTIRSYIRDVEGVFAKVPEECFVERKSKLDSAKAKLLKLRTEFYEKIN